MLLGRCVVIVVVVVVTNSCFSMVQVGIPKKPYNPILGEVFRCYWDVPDGKRTPPNLHEKVRTCS